MNSHDIAHWGVCTLSPDSVCLPGEGFYKTFSF